MNRITITAACLALLAASAAEAARRVELKTGDVLLGAVTRLDERHLTMAHPVLGELRIPRRTIEAISGNDAMAAAVAAAKEIEPPVPGDAPVPVAEGKPAAVKPPGFFDDWESSWALGASGSSGNVEASRLRTSLKSKKETPTDRWAFDTRLRRAESNDERIRNDVTVGLLKDWLIDDSRWFDYARGRHDYDAFRSWEHRSSAGGGVGFQWFDLDALNLRSRAGGNLTRRYRAADDGLDPEMNVTAELTWQIVDDQTLTAAARLFPDLGLPGEYRMKNTVNWSWKIGREHDLSLEFGVEHEYESLVDPGVEQDDLRYYGALSFDF